LNKSSAAAAQFTNTNPTNRTAGLKPLKAQGL
jgi:hypothetical protein